MVRRAPHPVRAARQPRRRADDDARAARAEGKRRWRRRSPDAADVERRRVARGPPADDRRRVGVRRAVGQASGCARQPGGRSRHGRAPADGPLRCGGDLHRLQPERAAGRDDVLARGDPAAARALPREPVPAADRLRRRDRAAPPRAARGGAPDGAGAHGRRDERRLADDVRPRLRGAPPMRGCARRCPGSTARPGRSTGSAAGWSSIRARARRRGAGPPSASATWRRSSRRASTASP